MSPVGRALVIANERAEHQKSWCGAFAEGLRRHGWRVDLAGRAGRPAGHDLVALWGVRDAGAIAAARAAGAEIAVLERGYLGDRFAWTSVSLGGGLNGRGRFGPARDDGRRFRTIARLAPWRERAGIALILGQVPGDMSVKGVDLRAAYEAAADRCREIGLDPWFRPHPLGVVGPLAVKSRPAGESLDAALAAAAQAVTINSNSGVDAALAGVPVVALDRGSMAWEVARHDVGPPLRPDREAWAARLAWTQWRRGEIARGDAWEALRTA